MESLPSEIVLELLLLSSRGDALALSLTCSSLLNSYEEDLHWIRRLKNDYPGLEPQPGTRAARTHRLLRANNVGEILEEDRLDLFIYSELREDKDALQVAILFNATKIVRHLAECHRIGPVWLINGCSLLSLETMRLIIEFDLCRDWVNYSELLNRGRLEQIELLLDSGFTDVSDSVDVFLKRYLFYSRGSNRDLIKRAMRLFYDRGLLYGGPKAFAVLLLGEEGDYSGYHRHYSDYLFACAPERSIARMVKAGYRVVSLTEITPERMSLMVELGYVYTRQCVAESFTSNPALYDWFIGSRVLTD